MQKGAVFPACNSYYACTCLASAFDKLLFSSHSILVNINHHHRYYSSFWLYAYMWLSCHSTLIGSNHHLMPNSSDPSYLSNSPPLVGKTHPCPCLVSIEITFEKLCQFNFDQHTPPSHGSWYEERIWKVISCISITSCHISGSSSRKMNKFSSGGRIKRLLISGHKLL